MFFVTHHFLSHPGLLKTLQSVTHHALILLQLIWFYKVSITFDVWTISRRPRPQERNCAHGNAEKLLTPNYLQVGITNHVYIPINNFREMS